MTQPAAADLAQARIDSSRAARRWCRGAELPKAALALGLSAVLTGCTGVPFGAAESTSIGSFQSRVATTPGASVDDDVTAGGAGSVPLVAASFKRQVEHLAAGHVTAPPD